MKARTLIVTAAALLAATFAGAQETKAPTLKYTPSACMKGGELPLLQIQVEGEGELRGYFRRTNTTDWCSVEGENIGPLSRIVLPKFEDGEEIEYFFVLLDGRRVAARSPRIYRASVAADCQTASARHIIRLSMSCGEDVQAVPTSLGAGYAMTEELVVGDPEFGSPDSPGNQ
jgi:hypothetical protein